MFAGALRRVLSLGMVCVGVISINTLAAWAQSPADRADRLTTSTQLVDGVSGKDAESAAALVKIHPALIRLLTDRATHQPIKAWVLFTDKDVPTPQDYQTKINNLTARYGRRAVARRLNRRTLPGLFDEHDLPVPQRYLDAVAIVGAELRQVSRWVNGVSALGTRTQFERIAALPFVKMIQPVRRGRRIDPTQDKGADRNTSDQGPVPKSAAGGFYGQSQDQLAQIELIAMHDLGYTGVGVVIGILDTGFQRSHVAFNEPGHPVNVIAEYDFIDDDPVTGYQDGDPPSQHGHGTYILGTIGAYKPGELVGGAYDAAFVLCKTEDITDEYPGEEDNYVAGLEFIEANGGDVATSSLSYSDWYTEDDYDGLTAVTTIAVNIATANGVHCCTAAGNAGHDNDPTTAHLGAPADALQVLTVGAVDSDGWIAYFSSDGPTVDGRVKPEVLARGVDTQTVSAYSDTDYAGVSGTSLSTPLVAAAVACLVQAHPEWTVDQMRDHLFQTADYYVDQQTSDPAFVLGYGIINALAAADEEDCNENGVIDSADIANGTSQDTNRNQIPDECENGGCCLCPPDIGCQDLTLFQCNGLGGSFAGGDTCATFTCPSDAPQNDDCPNSTVITEYLTAFDNRCATTDGPETATGECVFDPPDSFQHDVWFDYQADCTGTLLVDTLDTDFDALVAVYCNNSDTCSCPVDGSTEYACDDQDSAGSSLSVPVTYGKCYKIRVGGYGSTGGSGLLVVGCEETACSPASPPQADTTVTDLGDGTRNRYLSFRAGDPGYSQAIRIKLADLPPPFDEHEGETMWVGEPFPISEVSSVGDATPPTFNGAQLQCEPYFTDWSTEGTIHVFGKEIIPESRYEIQAVDSSCYAPPTMCFDGTSDENAFSYPLTVNTSRWGDVVGNELIDGAWAPPDGVVDFVDITAVVDKFRNLPTAPSKSQVDLAGDVPDRRVDFVDISEEVGAFRNLPYSFPGPIGCPESP